MYPNAITFRVSIEQININHIENNWMLIYWELHYIFRYYFDTQRGTTVHVGRSSSHGFSQKAMYLRNLRQQQMRVRG